MKQLSIEEKAKAYDEAIKRGLDYIKHTPATEMVTRQDIFEAIFPEFKESEGEKIRKAIIEHFRWNTKQILNEFSNKKALAWLEKQGKPVEINPSEFDLQLNRLLVQFESLTKEELESTLSFYLNVVKNGWPYENEEKQGEQKSKKVSLWKHWKDGKVRIHRYKNIAGNGEDKPIYLVKSGNSYTLSSCLGYECDYIELSDLDELMLSEKQGEKPQGKSAMEAINEQKTDNANKVEPKDYSSIDPHFGKPIEQKPADKVEPKFHEGDWTVSNLDKEARQISEVHFDEYNSYYVVNGKSVNLEEYDRLHHLWTIDDARDGNVLHSPSHHLIWIYKDNEHYYACVNMNYATKNVAINGLIIIPNDACPATKDEQTILFARMEEAGHEWDVEKKELKDIEHKHFCELDNSCACVKFPFKAKVKSSGKIVTIHGGQLGLDGKKWIKYQSDKEDGYKIYEPNNLELVCEIKQNHD